MDLGLVVIVATVTCVCGVFGAIQGLL